MVSATHEELLGLFRDRPQADTDLLRHLEVELPDFDTVRTDSSDLTEIRPTEYRADLVFFLECAGQKTLGVILEAQLSPDGDKKYAWPAYIANLRARHRCPVCLLVVTVDEDVGCWARSEIDLGPGSKCLPLVVSPSNAPILQASSLADKSIELAVLSVVERPQYAHDSQLARAVADEIASRKDLDRERAGMYLDLI